MYHAMVAFVFIVTCSAATLAQESPEDPAVAARQLELAERAQKAFDRIVAAQSTPLATSAEEVIDRAIAAMGGREALASLRTLSMTRTGFMVGGTFGARRWLKAPNLLRQERNGGLFVVTDGISAWQVDGDEWQPLPSGGSMWQQQFRMLPQQHSKQLI